jgi:hypothetical protein
MKSWLCLFALGATALAQVPRSNHVWVITEENHSYESVIGNPSMPYYNSLAKKYGLAAQYYSPMHNSLAALMWLVAGQMVTADNSTTTCWNVDNVVRHLLAQGLTWKSYQRDLPYAGFQGLYSGDYVRRHNPIIDFTDSCAPDQTMNSVPFTQLPTDIKNQATPNYAYVTPNLDEDAHDGTLPEADQWLNENLPQILGLPEFQPGGDGLMFIVWDEGDLGTDNRCSSKINTGCGGHIATLLIGPQVKPHYQSTVLYSHANLLRTVCNAMVFSSCPGAGAIAAPMADFFNTVNISTPRPDAAVTSPVKVQATVTNSSPVYAMQVYVDEVLKYQASGASLNASVPLRAGKHHLVVQSWDRAGGIHKSGIYVTAQQSAVLINSPTVNAVVASPVAIRAIGSATSQVQSMHAYVDGVHQFQASGSTLNTSLAITTGPHTLMVEARTAAGTITRQSVRVTVAKPTITVKSPAPNANVYSPVAVNVITENPKTFQNVQVLLDQQLRYEMTGTGTNAPVPMPLGNHYMTVRARDSAGTIYTKAFHINVLPVKVAVSAPVENSTVGSPVHVHASVPSNSTVFTIQVYVDNALKYQKNSKTIDTYLPMGPGKHFMVAQAWDNGGGIWKTGINVEVK